MAANALVSSRLDYCKFLCRGISNINQKKLQCIQNSLACIVTNRRKFDHVTSILMQLHWLPVYYRCILKTATLVYKYLHNGLSIVILDHTCLPAPPATTPDTARLIITIFKFHLFTPLSISHQNDLASVLLFDASRVWNGLPNEVCGASSVAIFRRKLKTYLFTKAYPP